MALARQTGDHARDFARVATSAFAGSVHLVYGRVTMNSSPKLPRLSFAKVFAAYCAIIGGILGLVYAVGGLVYDLGQGGVSAGTAMAFLAVLGMPLFGGLAGLFVGLALASPVRAILRILNAN
jgi:hypothetical protein